MADTPKTVTVTTLKWHTHGGKAYDVGDTYDVPESEVESLQAQGMAASIHGKTPPAPKPKK
jgi:hypothetical protein